MNDADHFKKGYKILHNVVNHWNSLDEQARYSNLSEADYHFRQYNE